MKCEVLINNDATTVIRYDGEEIQLPSIHREAKYINVELKDNQYIIVDDDNDKPKDNTVDDSTFKFKKKANKKTTLDENAKDTDNVDANEHLIDGE